MEEGTNEIERRDGADDVRNPGEEFDVELEQPIDSIELGDAGEREELLRASDDRLRRLFEEQNAISQEKEILDKKKEEILQTREMLQQRRRELSARIQQEGEDHQRQRAMLELQQLERLERSGGGLNLGEELDRDENNKEVQELFRARAQQLAEIIEVHDVILYEDGILRQLQDDVSESMEMLLARQRLLTVGFDREIEELRREHAILQSQQELQIEVCTGEEIGRLPIVEVTAEDVINEKKCAICCEIFVFGENVSEINCHHIFHRECVGAWLERSISCPLCRAPVNPSEWPEISITDPKRETSLIPDKETDFNE